MTGERADALERETGMLKDSREDLGRHLNELKHSGHAGRPKDRFEIDEEFDENFVENNKNTCIAYYYTLLREENKTESNSKAKAKSMLCAILNLQEYSVSDESESESDLLCVNGLCEEIEDIVREDSEEITKGNNAQTVQSRKKELKLEPEYAQAKVKCGEVTHLKRSTSNNKEKNGRRKYGETFGGWSKYKSVFVTYVWLLTTLTAVSAAPSFFDRFGRSSFDPFKCGCSGGGSKRARVVGGSELTQGSAPWLAAITKGGKSHCGAALVSRDHLLTAAHCIDGLHLDELRGWLGVHALSDAQSAGKGRKFRNAYPHPQFEYSGFRNDIAIMELQNTVHFSSSVRPVCLPSRADVEYASRTAIVAGWGRTAENDPPSDIPRQAFVQVWTKAKCRGAGYPAKRVAGEVLCAGLPKGGVDACQGDSGGPLILEGSHGSMEVIGVVSWGRGCARPNLPGIYTRVASYLSFIQNIIEGSCS